MLLSLSVEWKLDRVTWPRPAEDSKLLIGDRKVEGAQLPESFHRGLATPHRQRRGHEPLLAGAIAVLGLLVTEAWPALSTKMSKRIITKLWKQPKCPAVGDGLNELRYIHKT